MRWNHALPYALAIVGMLSAAIVPLAVGDALSRDVRLVLSVGGAVLMWVGVVWADRNARGAGAIDERYAAIYYRSGWYAWWVAMAVMAAFTFPLVNTDVSIPALWVLLGTMIAGVAVYVASVAYHQRTM